MAQNMNNSDFSINQESEWRKGPWTAEEDRLLIDYVKLYGEGRWNHVARLSGLKRNGKSCRLRWVNYLRPDLKRGQITPYEESIIVELHAKWGNRWSTIAKSLPGRTDNEIKNYWRTHFKNKSKPNKENPEKARARLLKKQQFRLQQQQQQSQLQQQLMILRSKDQIETEIFDGSGNSKMPNFDQLRQEIIAYPFEIDDQGLYYPIFDGYANVPEDSNEDNVTWDYGLWNLDYCHNYVNVRDEASVSY